MAHATAEAKELRARCNEQDAQLSVAQAQLLRLRAQLGSQRAAADSTDEHAQGANSARSSAPGGGASYAPAHAAAASNAMAQQRLRQSAPQALTSRVGPVAAASDGREALSQITAMAENMDRAGLARQPCAQPTRHAISAACTPRGSRDGAHTDTLPAAAHTARQKRPAWHSRLPWRSSAADTSRDLSRDSSRVRGASAARTGPIAGSASARAGDSVQLDASSLSMAVGGNKMRQARSGRRPSAPDDASRRRLRSLA